MLSRWKSDSEAGTAATHNPSQTKSFTQKKGVSIEPICVAGLRRDGSLDTAARRGLFHRKGAWSPASPGEQSQSPTRRRCCLDYGEEAGPGAVPGERRSSRGEAGGSDSSKERLTNIDSFDGLQLTETRC